MPTATNTRVYSLVNLDAIRLTANDPTALLRLTVNKTEYHFRAHQMASPTRPACDVSSLPRVTSTAIAISAATRWSCTEHPFVVVTLRGRDAYLLERIASSAPTTAPEALATADVSLDDAAAIVRGMPSIFAAESACIELKLGEVVVDKSNKELSASATLIERGAEFYPNTREWSRERRLTFMLRVECNDANRIIRVEAHVGALVLAATRPDGFTPQIFNKMVRKYLLPELRG